MFEFLILKLTKRFYPLGRAFRIHVGSTIEKVHNALVISENKAVEDSISVLDSILPDNNNFTEEDAADWERRLGLITNPLISLNDRKAALIRKINHPGDIPARQHYLYLERELQLANFDVFVHENIPEQNIVEILTSASQTQWGDNQFGDFQWGNVFSIFSDILTCPQWGGEQFGNFQWGECVYLQKIVNNIDNIRDIPFSISPNYKCTFVIGGEIKYSFAEILPEREAEFRQLVLKVKPAQTVALLLIDYNNSFKIIINTNNLSGGSSNIDEFQLPFINGFNYNCSVKWGDGKTDNITAFNQPETLHTYHSPGFYTIEIEGICDTFSFNATGDRLKIIRIERWGNIVWTSFENSFNECTNLVGNFSDAPNLSQVNSVASMFLFCSSYNTPMNNWDFSNVVDMSAFLALTPLYNQPILWKNTHNVQNMNSMFIFDSSFNQSIGSLNIESVTDMSAILSNTIIDTANYDDTLTGFTGWINGEATKFVQNGVIFSAPSATFTLGSDAEDARDFLINIKGWTVIDSGGV